MATLPYDIAARRRSVATPDRTSRPAAPPVPGQRLHGLIALARAAERPANALLRDFDISLRDWMVFHALTIAGSVSQRDLVPSSGLDKVAVNRACTRLKAIGWVTQRPHVDDRRSHVLDVTPTGQAMAERIARELGEFEKRLFAQAPRFALRASGP